MAIGTIGSVIDTLEFDTGNALYPKIISVTGDVYAVAYEGVDSDVWITTFAIDSVGDIGAVLDSTEVSVSNAVEAGFILIPGTSIVTISYRGVDDDGFVSTFSIAGNGS